MNPDITKCAAVIVRDGKYLILKDKDDSFWKNVGGKIEPDESPEECIKREVKEELDVDALEVAYYFSTPVTETESEPKRTLVIHLYKAEIKGEPKPTGEAAEIHWLSKEEFEKEKLYLATQIKDYIVPRLIKDGLIY